MSLWTVLWTILELIIIVMMTWIGLAFLIGGLRLAYQPLVFMAILELITAIPFIFAVFIHPWVSSYAFLVFIPSIIIRWSGLNKKVEAYLQSQGLAFRDVILFKSI